MAEHRAVRMGIDVGGTYTKCVAMDNLTHEIIGKNEVKTTHDDKDGVAAGVVQSFKNCMAENDIAPEDVVFVAHSTTQATNAFIEGDVASVGVIGVAGGGLEGFLAKRQLNLKDIVLDEKVGRKIPVHNRFLKKKEMTDEKINAAIKELCGEGSQVIVASMAFGVDNMDEEVKIHDLAEAQGLPYQLEAEPGVTGTDARAIQMARGGIPTGLVSVPLRYMHTPTEVICLRDLEATVRLITRFAQDLAPDTSFVPGLGGAVTENAEGKAAGADADADADASDASAAPEEA